MASVTPAVESGAPGTIDNSMDSITQAFLGAAVGEATLGRHAGNKAPLWGAVLGTLPDLDVFYPFADPVNAFTWHRGPSHSIFVLAVITPLIVRLIVKLHPGTADERRGWYRLVLLVFGTHVLLDCFTVYGTQALWPLPMPPVGWATIFIIDPLYTLPLAAGLLAASLLRRDPKRAWRWNLAGLALSSLYLTWSVGAKFYADHAVRDILAREAVRYEYLHVQPTPFNTLLWRVVGVNGNGYFEGLWSLVSPKKGLTLAHYEHRPDLLTGIEELPSVQRLQWFTKGLYRVMPDGNDVVIGDLRMGVEPDYVFAYRVAEIGKPHPRPIFPERIRTKQDFGRLHALWERI
ncbi:MAG: metal-dependent hydrolase [Thiohalocapsa sp.]